MPDLREQLQEFFGLDDFRPAQRAVIEDVLAGRNVLCVMPTGAGKSLCYQLPAVVQPGLTIVVSPLISLMQDQVQQLRDEGIPAAVINSTLTASMQQQVMDELEQGFDGLLYVAPERFYASSFQGMMKKLKPRLFAVDEAHCISQWGHDFRPEYSKLGEVRKLLGSPPTIALTATATEDVRQDIIDQLELQDPRVYVTGFDRPNLRYESRILSKTREKDQLLVQLLREQTGSGIVYCATRAGVDEVAELLKSALPGRPVFAYHAGMEQANRTGNQDRFMEMASAVAVATNAFGMGINKPDLRFVVHYNIPGTLEAYYQEAGRAGRDGLPSRCILFFSYQDRYIHEFFISKIGEDNNANDAKIEAIQEHATERLDTMIHYARTHRCRRQMILDYFGDLTRATNCECDVCTSANPSRRNDSSPGIAVSDEVTVLVRKLLSGIARISMRGQFGVGMIADVLAGNGNEKTQRWGFDQLSVFGLLRTHQTKRIIAMLHRLMEAGLAAQRDPEGMKFRPVVELTPSGVAVMKAQQLPPAPLADLIGQRPQSASAAVKPIAVVAEDPLDPASQSRFDRLRSVRMQLARERQVPPYCICHDKTLRAIARATPSDLAALEEIKGMGPNKVRMYGQAILDTLNDPAE